MTAEISRRRLLTVAGLTVGTAWVQLGGVASPAAAAPSGELTLEPVADEAVALLSATGAAPAAAPRHLAVRVVNEGFELAAGAQVKVAYDPRAYSALTTPMLTLGGRRVPATVTTAPDLASGEMVCTLTLGEPVPARSAGAPDLIALIGTFNAHRYPNDLALSSAAPTADVAAAGRQRHRSLRPAHPPAFGSGRPWGVELGSGWARSSWGMDGRFWYYYPTIVSVAATGPGSTPPAEFSVTVDPQVVTGMSVESARLNDKPYATSKITRAEQIETGTLRRVRWRTMTRLAPNDRLDVMLQVTTRIPTGPLETITHPVVSTGMGAGVAARQTGSTSVSRSDSSWQ